MAEDTHRMPVHGRGGRSDVDHGGGSDLVVVPAGGRTHRGCRRVENQDRMYVGERVFAVADGIGGHRGGGLAAELALEPVAALDDPTSSSPDMLSALRDAVEVANARVRARRQLEPDLDRMGTTLTAMVLAWPTAHIVHVGDSRLYRMRAGVLEQLTTDHTVVAHLVELGRLSPADVDEHPKKNLITRAVGPHDQIDVEAAQVPLAAGDTFLICSDGLTSALDEQRILETLQSSEDAAAIADRLVHQAVGAEASDNVTAVVVRAAGPEQR